jgi:hypothetical protein
MLLVQLGINSTSDVWKFCQTGLTTLGIDDTSTTAEFLTSSKIALSTN